MNKITITLTQDQVRTTKKALTEYARHNIDNKKYEQEAMFMLRLINKFNQESN